MPRGKPTQASGRLGDTARRLLGGLDHGGNIERSKAVAVWRQVAGDDVASHATGFAMRGGELVVYVDSSVWASELTALSEHYRTDVNAALGQETVGSIRFTVSQHVAKEQQRQSGADPGAPEHVDAVAPVPATEQELAQIEAMAEGIHDQELRQAAVRAAIRGLEWRKGVEAKAGEERAKGRRTGR